MFITFTSRDEVIITTKENENECVKLYFTEGGRNFDEYDRNEYKDHFISVEYRGLVVS